MMESELEMQLKLRGGGLEEVGKKDLQDFIAIENETHTKYILENLDFFGEVKEEIIVNGFYARLKMSFFKKVVLKSRTVGFLSYDIKEDKIDLVFIRLTEMIQNQGIGTLFLEYLKELSKALLKPIIIVAIKTNPAQELYKRLGFKFFKEEDVFYYFKYE